MDFKSHSLAFCCVSVCAISNLYFRLVAPIHVVLSGESHGDEMRTNNVMCLMRSFISDFDKSPWVVVLPLSYIFLLLVSFDLFSEISYSATLYNNKFTTECNDRLLVLGPLFLGSWGMTIMVRAHSKDKEEGGGINGRLISRYFTR